MQPQSKKLSITRLFSEEPPLWLRLTAPLIDRVLGIAKLNRLYQENGLPGTPPTQFYRKFIDLFQLKTYFAGADFSVLPARGPAIVVANHPHGGIDGILLRHLLVQHRSDLKVLSNWGISVLPEMSEHSIYTNPLANNAKGNITSLRACIEHLRRGGVLALFPAGRVSYPHGKPEAITDHQWNRIVATLQRKLGCPLITVHLSGQNRPWFYKLGKIWYRLRLLFLAREMLASHQRKVTFTVGRPLEKLPTAAEQQQTDLLYLLTYLNAVRLPDWPQSPQAVMKPLASPVSPDDLAAEIHALPPEQTLATRKGCTTYWATQAQAPRVVDEIRRLREETFRSLDEGSGEPGDGDDFDATYLHLFVFDHDAQRIIGAYRMGRSDQLLQRGQQGLYLSSVFTFEEGFVNRQRPCLELGRSFVVSDMQRSYHGLLMLFLGLGAFVRKHSQYRVLYGTVSLSKQYRPLSVALIQRWLSRPTGDAAPLLPFPHPPIPQLEHYLSANDAELDHLDWLIRQIEPDGKGLPVLVKKYHQLGARFHGVGIDQNFAHTPGLLLSVDLDGAPERFLRLYLGEEQKEGSTA